jgi:anti-sigma regulatory factor (Ser/Thr protein kinase)
MGPEQRSLVARLSDLSKVAPVDLNIVIQADHVLVHGLALIATWCERYAANVRIDAKQKRVQHYLERTGFKKVVEECVTIDAPLFDQENFVALTRIDREEQAEADAISKRLVDLFERVLGLRDEQKVALGVLFAELVENVYRHAQSNCPGYVMAQAHPDKQKLHVVVADSGIGVFGSFRQSSSPEIRSRATDERRAIEMALEKLVTSKVQNHAGYGLYIVKRLVQSNHGWMRLLSGRCTYQTWHEKRPMRGLKLRKELTDNLPWRGTEVSLMFDLKEPLPLQSVYRELGPQRGYEEDFFG